MTFDILRKPPAILRQGYPSLLRSYGIAKYSYGMACHMYYSYILLSSKSHIFYFGSTNNLKLRLKLHNNGKIKSTKPHTPWKLIWYAGFSTEKEARDFEQYLKTGSGKSFAYRHLVQVALKKDFSEGRISKGVT